MPPFQLNIACEGPLALNDNAFELCRDFLKPGGDTFFTRVSRLADYLADIAQKEGSQAGDACKLILPFLKAAGLTNATLTAYAEKNLRLVPDAQAVYPFLHKLGFPIFEISTSYRQFAEVAGKRLGFAPERIFCTELDLDRYSLAPAEAERLLAIKDEIAALPELVIPPPAKKPADLAAEARDSLARLERIFGEIVPEMDIGRLYQEVNPVGGPEKAKALAESLAQTGVGMAEAMYVGDSVTDVVAFKTVRAGGGTALSFNGNRYAVNAAEFIVVADNAWPVALLMAIFQRWGKDGLMELATSSQAGHQKIVAIPEAVIEPIITGLRNRNFSYYPAPAPNKDRVIQESAAMRLRLRGEAAAALG